jgi:hypothetical protein
MATYKGTRRRETCFARYYVGRALARLKGKVIELQVYKGVSTPKFSGSRLKPFLREHFHSFCRHKWRPTRALEGVKFVSRDIM